jgi:hypothetical protein
MGAVGGEGWGLINYPKINDQMVDEMIETVIANAVSPRNEGEQDLADLTNRSIATWLKTPEGREVVSLALTKTALEIARVGILRVCVPVPVSLPRS